MIHELFWNQLFQDRKRVSVPYRLCNLNKTRQQLQ